MKQRLKNLVLFLLQSGPTCGLFLLVVALAGVAVVWGYQSYQAHVGVDDGCSRDYVISVTVLRQAAWMEIHAQAPDLAEPDSAIVYYQDGGIHVALGHSGQFISARVLELCLNANDTLSVKMSEWAPFDETGIFPLDRLN